MNFGSNRVLTISHILHEIEIGALVRSATQRLPWIKSMFLEDKEVLITCKTARS